MATNNVRANGGFAPLSATYYEDDAILEAGPMAELLFVRSIAFCAKTLSDGFVSSRQLSRSLAPDLDDAEDLAEVLVTVGLWTHADGGYTVRSWLKWNRSREEITRNRAKDAARKRGDEPTKRNPTPPPTGGGEPSKGTPNGIRAESKRNGAGIHQPHTHTHTHTSPHTAPTTQRTLPLAQLAEHEPEDKFHIFWTAYPRKVDKRSAEKAWRAALKRGAQPDAVILAARSYAETTTETEPRFIKHPGTWLNAAAYENAPEQRLRAVSGGYQPFRSFDEADYIGHIPLRGDE